MLQILARKSNISKNLSQGLARIFLENGTIAHNLLSTRYMSQKLLKQPVPPLMATMDKYFKSVKPFLNNQEVEETKLAIKDFIKDDGVGQKLQSLLEERAAKSENWLADWWMKVAYLAYRDPNVIYANPGEVFPYVEFRNDEDRYNHAANILLGALEYKGIIDRGEVPEEKMGKYPLDMQQYNKIFGTCRIPGEKVDSMEYNRTSKHIVVAHNNNWFRLDVIGANGQIPSKRQIVEALKSIEKLSGHKNENPVGILSSQYRDTWGKVYKNLLADGTNRDSVLDIQSSILVLCLDNPMNILPDENQQSMASRQCIHGGGSAYNTGNRWFDKTIQFIIGRDGSCGIYYEHTSAEGGPIGVITDFVVDYSKADKGKALPDTDFTLNPKPLQFNLTPELKQEIEAAKVNIDKLVANLDMNCFTFKDYGKEFIKSQKLSPDSYIQMALQYTFYRIHKTPGGHYESAGLRKFLHGRTETIRSTSEESIEFAKCMLDTNKSPQEQVEALRKAIDSHKKYTFDAINGMGCDRHLLGLKLIALEKGLSLPALYNDSSFKRSTHMRISSSQVPTNTDAFMCYAPLTPDGYGCCYNPRPHNILFACSAFNEDPNTIASNFRRQLSNSLLDMQSILAKTHKAKL